MPVTIGDLLKIPNLGLARKPLAGAMGASNAIRWVHVSELEDPTPWLKGGELLLTTGMGVGRSPAGHRAYLNRLADAGLAGLGFGTGFSFRAVPRTLADAAERRRFPLFEVPYAVPFIAITEAVFTRLVAEEYDVLSRALDAEQAMTRRVLDGQGMAGILQALTRETRGWVVLLDLRGAVLAASPKSAAARAGAVLSELSSLPGDGVRFSVSVVRDGQHVAVHPVVAQGRVEAFLAVGKAGPVTQFDRIVSSHALSLLALELTKARAVSEAERRLKGELLERILAGSVSVPEAQQAMRRLGFDLALPVSVVAFSGGDVVEVDRAVQEALAAEGSPFLTSIRDEVVLSLVQPAGPGFLPGLREDAARRAPTTTVLAGAGSAVPFERILQGVREARYALQVCRSEGRLHAEFANLGTYQLLLSLQDPEALRAFADSVLGPLDRYDEEHGGDLVPSLRAFLERNARWESAAKDLVVHRHTLRYRMRKVEELSGRHLSSARDRMEFFLALRARDMVVSGEWAAGAAGTAGAGGAAPGPFGPEPTRSSSSGALSLSHLR